MTSEPDDPFPAAEHDHARCVADALDRAAALCAARGVKLTELRRRVLEIVLDQHAPVGAYTILERLASERGRVAPPTVYRALDFLVAQGLVHRLDTKNAFVACARADGPHPTCFLLCRDCGAVAEVADSALEQAIAAVAARTGFALARRMVELEGVCARCRAASGARQEAA
ncbi:MAG: transcriptional repressor [Geminicoccaceae bacterium]|nr:transcriptional repressor [Geminicoccaceae bacterium]MCX7629339.1 transcriptional repressor [Geminicoccaceae bacterium]MDW8125580.1 Fur family transcriptional regulator [Geminicoccaceae bacterium]MDW8340766.1 Fur family transcriptional regulator [Geminicoccaceae bacterium]